MGVGLLLPFSPAAPWLGFRVLPPAFLLLVLAATAAYLSFVQIVKRRLAAGLLGEAR